MFSHRVADLAEVAERVCRKWGFGKVDPDEVTNESWLEIGDLSHDDYEREKWRCVRRVVERFFRSRTKEKPLGDNEPPVEPDVPHSISRRQEGLIDTISTVAKNCPKGIDAANRSAGGEQLNGNERRNKSYFAKRCLIEARRRGLIPFILLAILLGGASASLINSIHSSPVPDTIEVISQSRTGSSRDGENLLSSRTGRREVNGPIYCFAFVPDLSRTG